VKEVKIQGNLVNVLRELYNYRVKGEHVYCMYEGIRLESDSISGEVSSIAISMMSKEEFESLPEKDQDEVLEKMISKNREMFGTSPITKDLVVNGLKYICEHQKESQFEIVKGLLEMGCNFSYKDIDIALIHKSEMERKANNPMELTWICQGANKIISVMSTVSIYDYILKFELETDGKNSMYDLVRKLTGEDYYCYDYVMNMIGEKKRR